MKQHLHRAAAGAILSALCLSMPVWAHGPAKAQHGGVLQTASELTFELVRGVAGVSLYVDDHGTKKSTQGASGQLTVLSAGQKSLATLVPAGENQLDAKGLKVAKGAKVVAAVTFADQKSVTVRFTLN
jgi:hypothetical protein